MRQAKSTPRKGTQDPDRHARFAFVRLPEVPVESILELLNEPRIARHMPLARALAPAEVAEWVREKDAQWIYRGIGPWAVLVDEVFAGWGGFEAETGSADLALVLSPTYWGHGAAIAEEMLVTGFDEFDLSAVTIALPPSRNASAVVARFGFEPDGVATHSSIQFQRYRLTREDWRNHRPG